ncbi:single-stranded DNA-binding protein [Frankia nepalensis]|uniref:single-stranded DNA-binding protein n=1 Tax=Frankia nepalensis TaxID=1836974 RepID=UPI001EE4CD38|nr:single-stranded DNA-binding protein [Frankia nepalensis]
MRGRPQPAVAGFPARPPAANLTARPALAGPPVRGTPAPEASVLDATLYLVGNLLENPNLKVTPTGLYVCSFRIVSSERRYDRKENNWVDGPQLFLDVTCWRRLAEHVAATLSKGDRAILIGRLRQREFENAQGEKRRRYEIEAVAVGPELAWHPARVQRAVRGGGTVTRLTEQPGAAAGSAAPQVAAAQIATAPVGGATVGGAADGPARDAGARDGVAAAEPDPFGDSSEPWVDGEPFLEPGAIDELTDETTAGWSGDADGQGGDRRVEGSVTPLGETR